MRRIFIIREDLHLTAGKLAAMVGHAAELYWLNLIKRAKMERDEVLQPYVSFFVPDDIYDNYITGIYTKTICESRNLTHLLKAKAIADELGLKENEDYGFINDKCLTELKQENEDGTTTVGMWFAPLADDTAHKISRNFPLYRDRFSVECPDKVTGYFDLTKEGNEAERIRRFQEICKQSEGGLQTFRE